MTRPLLPEWSQDKLQWFWQLQQRGLLVGLRLTVDMAGEFHLRDTNGGTSVPPNLDAAEAAIAAAEADRGRP